MGKMVRLERLTKSRTVTYNATDTNAAKVHPMIAFSSANQSCFRRHSFLAPVRPSHFKRRISTLRTRSRIKNSVKTFRHKLSDTLS